MANQRALLPVYRLRFNLLYQFGFLDVNPNEWVSYEQQNTNGHPEVDEEQLLDKLPLFSTADEVLLLDIIVPEQTSSTLQTSNATDLGFQYPKLTSVARAALKTLAMELSQIPNTGKVRLTVSQVLRLYPLTAQAGQLLATRLDPRVRRQNAVFEHVAHKADEQQLAAETKLGCEAIFTIVGLPVVQTKQSLLLDIRDAVAVRLGQRNVKPEDSFWVHLIAYDRYEAFPRNDYGYLYDLCVVFSRFKSTTAGGMAPPDDYKRTGFYTALEANQAQAANSKVTRLLLEEEWAAALRQQLTNKQSGQRDFLVAFLYLKLRQDFAADDYAFQRRLIEQVRTVSNFYEDETAVALQLLGGLLTFDKLASAYYDEVRLPLFQEQGRRLKPLTDSRFGTLPKIETPSTSGQSSAISLSRAKLGPDAPAPEVELYLSAEQQAKQRERQTTYEQNFDSITVAENVEANLTASATASQLLELTAEEPVPKKPRGRPKKSLEGAVKAPAEKNARVKASSRIKDAPLAPTQGELSADETQVTGQPTPDVAPEM